LSKFLGDVAPPQDNWKIELKEEEFNYEVIYTYEFCFIFSFSVLSKKPILKIYLYINKS
jgi:hypothetical protein